MFRLEYINDAGDSVYFGDQTLYMVDAGAPGHVVREGANFYFLSQKGMDGASAEAMLLKSPYQRGQTWAGVNVDERIVTVEACLVTGSLEEEEECRRRLINTMNCLRGGKLIVYGDTFVKAFPDVGIISGPTFKDQDYTAPDGILFFSFIAVVPGNFLEDFEQLSCDMVEVAPMFEFELEFAPDIIFGDMTNGSACIVNDGDAEAPLIVEIPGPVKTPSVTNLNTGEFIRVNTPILAGEVMTINTAFGKKSVTIRDQSGNERSAFNYIDLNSVFFQLGIGENYIKFLAEEGNDTAKVKIYYKRLYLGV
ncbi:MAG: phage tail family protein [Defluviitaleaceae bacterium]|nr:phage tail family protein [Defluviitaleaceae bacterium]